MGEQANQSYTFAAEVKRLLHLIIHSVYSEREIFLRELISNASDALDRLRFAALTDESLVDKEHEPLIDIIVDAQNKTITVRDNGIGMNKGEVVQNLGTIAHSGTREFLTQLGANDAKASNLIGQFGIGFYSAFIVAEKVVVETRKAGADSEPVRWVSNGEGEYTLEPGAKTSTGTDVVLHLREDAAEFLEPYRLSQIVRTYSDHIPFPIRLREGEDGSVKTLNRASALWTRAKNEISKEEYTEFYKHVSYDYQEPLAHVHSRIEGNLAYTLLLFVPGRAPYNMWTQHAKHGVRLYVRRVFISDDVKNLLPDYLRFVRGVIDSDDIPLNISRELLQQNRIINEIRATAVKRILGLLTDLAKNEPEKYSQFWKEFGEAIKEGMDDDTGNRDTLKTLLRFNSTHGDSREPTVSLADYVGRMKENQSHIYYLTADSLDAARSSPHLEVFAKKDVEVLLLHKPNDPWMMQFLADYEGKPFKSVSTAKLDLEDLPDQEESKADPEEKKNKEQEQEESFRLVLSRMEKALGERVHEVVLSKRLSQSPVCLVAQSGRDVKEELRRVESAYHKPQFVLELNPEHKVIQHLRHQKDDDAFRAWAEVLHQQAVLSAGGELPDPAKFTRQLSDVWQSLLA